MKQEFQLGALLSVVYDKLMCDFVEVHKLLDFISNSTLFAHQLPDASRKYTPYLLKQFPFLIIYQQEAYTINRDNWYNKLEEYEIMWGCEHEVEQMIN